MLNPAVPDRYELKSYSFSHNRNADRMKELIDRASAERKWLILYLQLIVIHEITEKGVKIYGERDEHQDENRDKRNE